MNTDKIMGFEFYNGQLVSPLLSSQDAKLALFKCGLRDKVVDLGVHYSELLDYLNDRYRDWPGGFYTKRVELHGRNIGPIDEVFVNMNPLYDAPLEWWRDTFGPKAIHRPIVRVRCEALPRWCAIGSLFYAWYPNQKPVWLGTPANDNEQPDGA